MKFSQCLLIFMSVETQDMFLVLQNILGAAQPNSLFIHTLSLILRNPSNGLISLPL